MDRGPDYPVDVRPGRFGHRVPVSLRLLANWRVWLPALILAEAVAVEMEFVIRSLTIGLIRDRYHFLSVVFEGLLIAVPIALFVVWRQAAYRATDAFRKLQASEDLREDLVNMLVHDLRNALTSSGASVEMLTMNEDLAAKLSDGDRHALLTAQENLHRAENMIGDILNVAQAEDGRMPVDLAEADVSAAVRAALIQFGPRAAGLGITITETYPPEPCLAVVDVEKVARVVENLLANALRFTPRDGRIEVSVMRAESGEARVRVWDDGTPIPEHVRERIFDKFVQAAAARRHERSSVGLGLTFCKLAVEAMGGKIWATSTEREGTSFTFTLPAS